MTQDEIRQAAVEGRVVVFKVRSSTDTIEIRGRVREMGEVYRNGEIHSTVSVEELGGRSTYRVTPWDILRIEGAPAEKEKAEAAVEYRVIGRAGSEEYRIMAYRGGSKAALYSGYADEERGMMRLYIKEPYLAGMPGRDRISLNLLRRG